MSGGHVTVRVRTYWEGEPSAQEHSLSITPDGGFELTDGETGGPLGLSNADAIRIDEVGSLTETIADLLKLIEDSSDWARHEVEEANQQAVEAVEAVRDAGFLREKNDEYLGEMRQLRGEIATQAEQLQCLRDALAAKQVALDTATSKVTELTQARELLANGLSVVNDDLVVAQDLTHRLRNDVTHLAGQVKHFKNADEKIRRESDRLRGENEILRRENATIRGEYGVERNGLLAEAREAERRRDALAEELSEVRDRLPSRSSQPIPASSRPAVVEVGADDQLIIVGDAGAMAEFPHLATVFVDGTVVEQIIVRRRVASEC